MALILGGIMVIWGILTLVAQREGAPKFWMLGDITSAQKALIVYNPDLFYNLDEQVCTSFAKGLGKEGWHSRVATVAAASALKIEDFDLLVFCANTYNWSPDWPTSRFIKGLDLEKKPVVAITLGSGSTNTSQEHLENLITDTGGHLIGSKSYWLMRPNDETRTNASNVKIAIEKAEIFGEQIGIDFLKSSK
ncbi:MAG: hypothetical protein MUO53_06650 [Maribacter sp.]|nr:hypothetical protein [Maribacter sp.]